MSWTPMCENCPPVSCTDYLVWVGGRYMIGHWMGSGPQDGWYIAIYDGPGQCVRTERLWGVRAWMPLPEAYRGGEN